MYQSQSGFVADNSVADDSRDKERGAVQTFIDKQHAMSVSLKRMLQRAWSQPEESLSK